MIKILIVISILFPLSISQANSDSCAQQLDFNTAQIKKYENIFGNDQFLEYQNDFKRLALSEFSFYFNDHTSQRFLKELINSGRVQVITVNGEVKEGPFIVAPQKTTACST